MAQGSGAAGGGIAGETGNERVEYGTISMSSLEGANIVFGGTASFAKAFSSAPLMFTAMTDPNENAASSNVNLSQVAGKQYGSQYSSQTTTTSIQLYSGEEGADGGFTHVGNWMVIGE